MLRAALTYPFRGERRGRRLLGSLVLVASLVILVTVPIYLGYLVRILRTAAYGDEVPPGLADVGGLFVEGLSALALIVSYAALPLSPFVVASLPFVPVDFGVGGRVALAVVGVVLAYVLPAVLCSYAVAGNVVGGLSVPRIVRALRSRAYLVAWLAAVAFVAPTLAGIWVLGGLGIGPTLVVGAPLVLYGTVAGFYLVGTAFGETVTLPRRPVRRHGA